MKKERIFHLEDLEIPVPMFWDERVGRYLYDYPIFSEEPIHTGTGRLCVNACQEACEYVELQGKGKIRGLLDCGSCRYYKAEKEKDLIGVCMCEKKRIT